MMDSSRWQQIELLFDQASALPLAEQSAYLESRCADDPELLTEVETMLEKDRGNTRLLDSNLLHIVNDLIYAPDIIPTQSFGPYRLIRALGEGGMGVVWLAERRDVGNQVAIKFLLHAGLSPLRSKMFTREIRTLARLKHQYIARLYDAGMLANGTPWFVMEYVDGEGLLDYCNHHALSLRERLQLFHSVCEAVQYAHGQEIIHRDLKPSNILVAMDGTPRLLDFGIAKQMRTASTAEDATRSEFRMLTPAYSAPEWVNGGHAGFATDVYSLGIILFELLAGRRPKSVSNTHDGASPCDSSPEALSVAVKEGLQAIRDKKRVSSYGRSAMKDLDAFCLRARHPDVQHRYQSVEALLRDLDHFLNGEPLEARPDTFRYKAEKFLRRHLNLVASGILILGLFAGVVGYFTFRLAQERNAALAEAARTKRVELFMENLFDGGDPQVGPVKDLQVTTVLGHGVRDAQSLNSDPAIQADLYLTLGHVYEKLGNFTQAETLFQEARGKSRQTNGEDSAAYGKVLLASGLLKVYQAQLPEAERLVREALSIEVRNLPANHPAVVDARIALGRVHIEEGHYESAISELKETLPLIPTHDDARLAEPLSLLGDAYFYLGKYVDADSFYRQAMVKDVILHGTQHPSVADIYINLGHIQGYLANYAKSEEYYRRAMEIDESWYGKDNPETADAMNYVADECYWEGRNNEAAALLKTALDIMVRYYGENHPRVALVLGTSGMVAHAMGHLQDAHDDYTRAANIYRNIYGENHHMFAVEIGNIASLDLDMNKYAEAERLLRQAIKIDTAAQSPTHINVGIDHIRLGRSILRQKRYREAEVETLEGYHILQGQTASDSKYLQRARQDLIVEYEAQHELGKALKYKAEFTTNLSSGGVTKSTQ
jgi:eukaryotic-like serine/threonine-protein kinase